MDFLLIVLTIGGLVLGGVMLLLASRESRMQRESEARVQTLQTLATGSVLFADAFIQSADDAVELGDAVVRPARPVTVDKTPEAYPFVVTVPVGAGRVPGSFHRTPQRNRT